MTAKEGASEAAVKAKKRRAWWWPPSRLYKKVKLRALQLARELVDFIKEFFWFIVHGTRTFIYQATLPITSRLLSRCPTPPLVSIKDVRANRIRLDIQSSFSSPFNVESFEIEWKPANSDTWTSTGRSDLHQRTVAKLQADTEYKFRVRAVSSKGTSSWSPELSGRTKFEPVNGGTTNGRLGFTWEQTPSDVTIMIALPAGTTKHDVVLDLKPDHIRVAVKQADSSSKVLLEGPLYGQVRTFEKGSVWEMSKDAGQQVLTLTLEKTTKSVAPKFDYWRAIIPGQHEIDTHKISNEDTGTGMQMLHPGQYNPMQMRNMGVKGF